MSDRAIFRCHYRGRLDSQTGLQERLDECREAVQKLIDEKRLMTAALYHFENQLFLYYEAIGEEIAPEQFMSSLHPLLAQWPQKEETCDWARMYHVYWHDEPRGESDWQREKPPERRRGRIAYLKHDTLFRYVYHHYDIVEEGLLRGDRYQSIALHEDVLFSYFEEPRSSVNVRRDPDGESEAIKGWLDVDPESHFIPLPGSNGANFLLLPEYFALGNI